MTDLQFKINKLYSLLYPTGRAWNYVRESGASSGQTEVYTDGLGVPYTDGAGQQYTFVIPGELPTTGLNYVSSKLQEYIRSYEAILSNLDSVLPDNNNFDETDAINWERVFQIKNTLTDLDQRKSRIAQRIFHPNGIEERGTAQFLEDQLQLAGFNVYVHENRFFNGVDGYQTASVGNAVLNEFNLGTINLGGGTISNFEVVANYLEASKDQVTLTNDTLKLTFFVGGQSFPARADVPAERKNDIKELILKLKPVQTAGLLLIDYV